MKKTLKAQTHKNKASLQNTEITHKLCLLTWVYVLYTYKEQEKMRSACEVILSSSITIISSSSNTGFRNACLASMKVCRTEKLNTCIQTLGNIVSNK